MRNASDLYRQNSFARNFSTSSMLSMQTYQSLIYLRRYGSITPCSLTIGRLYSKPKFRSDYLSYPRLAEWFSTGWAKYFRKHIHSSPRHRENWSNERLNHIKSTKNVFETWIKLLTSWFGSFCVLKSTHNYSQSVDASTQGAIRGFKITSSIGS